MRSSSVYKQNNGRERRKTDFSKIIKQKLEMRREREKGIMEKEIYMKGTEKEGRKGGSE